MQQSELDKSHKRDSQVTWKTQRQKVGKAPVFVLLTGGNHFPMNLDVKPEFNSAEAFKVNLLKCSLYLLLLSLFRDWLRHFPLTV